MSGNGTAMAAEKPSVLLGPGEQTWSEDGPKAFRARHRWLPYTMDFNRSKEAVTNDKTLDLKWRVLEAFKLNCWANFRDYYSDEKGRPVSQSDIARRIGEDKQRVSEAIGELVEERYLRRAGLGGRILFLIDDPELERKSEEKANDCPDGSDNPAPKPPRSGEEKEKAEEFWAQHNPDRFKFYQESSTDARKKEAEWRAALDLKRQLREEMFEAYRAWQKTQADAAPEADAEPTRPDNSSDPSGQKTSATYGQREPDLPTRPDVSSDPSGQKNGASLFGSKAFKEELASSDKNGPDELIERAVEHSSPGKDVPGLDGLGLAGNRRRAIQNAAAKLALLPPQQRDPVLEHFGKDLRKLAGRRENKPTSWGIIVSAMEDAILAIERKPKATPHKAQATAPAELSIKEIEEKIELNEKHLGFLAPDHPDVPYVRDALASLRQQLATRKPAESERGEAKAQKAGQG
jgi:hypothetical protein